MTQKNVKWKIANFIDIEWHWKRAKQKRKYAKRIYTYKKVSNFGSEYFGSLHKLNQNKRLDEFESWKPKTCILPAHVHMFLCETFKGCFIIKF